MPCADCTVKKPLPATATSKGFPVGTGLPALRSRRLRLKAPKSLMETSDGFCRRFRRGVGRHSERPGEWLNFPETNAIPDSPLPAAVVPDAPKGVLHTWQNGFPSLLPLRCNY